VADHDKRRGTGRLTLDGIPCAAKIIPYLSDELKP
jgi:hypothetical protein